MFKNAYDHSTQTELDRIRNRGDLVPIKFGFKSWDKYDEGDYLMASRGTYILIGGEPHFGKTEFTNELISQLMEKHNFKIALFSTESGNIANIFATFYSMHIGKSYSKLRPDMMSNPYAMSEDERNIAESFINKHLWVFDQQASSKDGYTNVENIYKMVAETERNEDIKFDSVVIDPIYDLDDFEPKAADVRRVLSYIDLQCEKNNRVDIVVNHVADTPKQIGRDGKRRKMKALADEFYGGKNNQRKAKLMILVDRPTPDLNPVLEEDFVAENQTDIVVLKAKPKGIAKMGTYKLFYDWRYGRYYEFNDGDFSFSTSSRLFGTPTLNCIASTKPTNINDTFINQEPIKSASLQDAFFDSKIIDDDGLPF